MNPLRRAAEDATYLQKCLAADLIQRLDAHTRIPDADWEAYNRAEEYAKDAWALVDQHDTDEWFREAS